MNSKERIFSFETNFERTTDKFQKNVIWSNDLSRTNLFDYFSLQTIVNTIQGLVEISY